MARKHVPVWLVLLTLPILLMVLLVGQKTVMAEATQPVAVADKAAMNQTLHQTILKEHTGFMVGKTTDGGGPTYVFFDPQCNHCLNLWQQAKPLNSKYQLTWIPVNLLGEKSLEIGATLIESKTPSKIMEAKSKGVATYGMDASSALARDKVQANLTLLKKLGFDSVPLVLRYNEKSKNFSADLGSMTTQGLEELLKMGSAPAD